MAQKTFIGWDIGGAHLKVAQVSADGKVISAQQLLSPIWQGLDKLDASFREAKRFIPDNQVHHSVTTTAELSDIFSNRQTGIGELVKIITNILSRNTVRFYGGKSGWIAAENTNQYVHEIASANWHATASYVATRVNNGILVDIGSTTTDIIPFQQGQLLNLGYTDHERLKCRELVYTGVVRTPVMGIINELNIEGSGCPVIPELFATMADVYRVTGQLQEEDDMMPTADNTGKTVFESARRLARMFAIDIEINEPVEKWIDIAGNIADRQMILISDALMEVLTRTGIREPALVGAGSGRFLVKHLAKKSGYPYIDFADILEIPDELKSQAARSAAAVSVAQLARLVL